MPMLQPPSLAAVHVAVNIATWIADVAVAAGVVADAAVAVDGAAGAEAGRVGTTTNGKKQLILFLPFFLNYFLRLWSRV
jgi:hypothetical protein